MTTPAENRPDYVRPEVMAMRPVWRRCRDLMGGTDAMRHARTLYLPQHPGESSESYNIRLALTELYNGYARTVEAGSGMIYAKDPQLGPDVPTEIRRDWEDIDGLGTHGDVFLRDATDEGLAVGGFAILVDHPPRPAEVGSARPTLGQVDRYGLRPFWSLVHIEQIISWRHATIAGRRVLTSAVLEENVPENEGLFGVRSAVQYRHYARTESGEVVWAIWRPIRGTETRFEVVVRGYVRGPRGIPLAICRLGRKLNLVHSRPPLDDLAHTNLAHYRVLADRRYAMHLADVPTLVLEGAQPGDTVQVGPNAVLTPSVGAKAYWLETTGGGLSHSHAELQELKSQMAAFGAGFLFPETRGTETAEAKRIDSSAQNATLASAARAVQDAVELALQFSAEYRELPDGGGITINQEFERPPVSPQLMQAYLQRYQAGTIPLRVLLAADKKMGVLPDDEDLGALETEIETIQAARAEEAERAAEARMLGSGRDTREAA